MCLQEVAEVRLIVYHDRRETAGTERWPIAQWFVDDRVW